MARAVRVEFPGAIYHLMARGVARLPTFLDDEDRRHFLDLLGELVDTGALQVHAFCLMPNHYHILCETPEGGLARWLRHLNGDYAGWFNHRHHRVGHLWQGRYKAIVVEDGRYLQECSRYIHLNPNRAKLTRPAERYRWSSYRNYVGGPTVADWVQTRRVLSGFASDRKQYRAYVEAGKGEKAVSPFERAMAGLVLGGEAFVARVRALLAHRPDSGETPALRRLRRSAKPTFEQVQTAVEQVFHDESAWRRNRLLLYALRKHSGLGTNEIARRLCRTPAAVPVAVKAVERRVGQNRAFAGRIGRLRQVLRGAGED